MRRPNLPVFLALAGLAGGIIGFTIYAHENESPFAFGEARPGVEFAEMDDDSQRNQGRRFSCAPIAGSYRVCEVTTDGPPGKMRIAVDDAGRVVVVGMTISETSSRVADLTDKVRKQWNRVAGDGVLRTTATNEAIDWRTANGRWSARMRMKSLSLGMEEIVMTDERALARLDGKDLATLLPLADLIRHRLASDTLLDAIEKRSPGTLLRAADARSARARARAAMMPTLSRCAPTVVPVAERANPEEWLGERTLLVQQMIGAVYGGRRIVLADQPYLMDDSGVGEPVMLTAPTEDLTGERVAFAVTFTGRADSLDARIERGEPLPLCRAPVDVIVARIDTARRAVIEVSVHELEHEATSTRAKDLSFITSELSRSPLAARYESVYADSDWYGAIAWEDVLAADSLTALARRPDTFVKTSGARAVSGRIIGDTSTADPLARYAPDRLSGKRAMVLLFEKDRDPSPALVTIPSAVNGAPSGWTLLAIF